MKNAWRGSKGDDMKNVDINDLFLRTEEPVVDNTDDELDAPILMINLDEVDEDSKSRSSIIVERLSNYYFDDKYVKEHPYIVNKISQEMDNVRRLLKMLAINEKAQDALLLNITTNSGKGSLYSSLTSLQNATLSIQSQLNTLTESLETIFRDMQAECDKTFAEKDHEEANEDGSMTVRGSREFLKQLKTQLYGKKIGNSTVDTSTGEIIEEEEDLGDAKAEDILGVG